MDRQEHEALGARDFHGPWTSLTGRVVMLVLSRNENDSIEIGREIVVTILSVKGGKVRVGIEAPQEVNIVRREIKGRGPKSDEKRSA